MRLMLWMKNFQGLCTAFQLISSLITVASTALSIKIPSCFTVIFTSFGLSSPAVVNSFKSMRMAYDGITIETLYVVTSFPP